MKIKQIETHVIKSQLDTPFAFSQGWVQQRAATLIEIKTDFGITGWGECFPQGLEPPEIAAAAVEKCFSEIFYSSTYPLNKVKIMNEVINKYYDVKIFEGSLAS